MANGAPPLYELPEVKNWRIEKEDWSKYELLEGRASVWIRAVVTKIFRIPEDFDGTYAVGTESEVTAFCYDDELRGEPTGEFDPNQASGQPLDPTTIDEPWNKYLLATGDTPKILRVKAVLTGLEWHPDKFNPFGDPIFQTDTQVVVGQAAEAEGFVEK